jgi:hypothetical protein
VPDTEDRQEISGCGNVKVNGDDTGSVQWTCRPIKPVVMAEERYAVILYACVFCTGVVVQAETYDMRFPGVQLILSVWIQKVYWLVSFL